MMGNIGLDGPGGVIIFDVIELWPLLRKAEVYSQPTTSSITVAIQVWCHHQGAIKERHN